MREHEYRGKSLVNGKWIYGDLVHDINGGCYIYPLDCKGLFLENKVDAETVCEFTTLRDKNKEKIFEGDILQHKLSHEPFGVVKWSEDGYFCICEGAKDIEPVTFNEQRRSLGYMLRLSIEDTPVDFEVVGNVFDNPEMLETFDKREN